MKFFIQKFYISNLQGGENIKKLRNIIILSAIVLVIGLFTLSSVSAASEVNITNSTPGGIAQGVANLGGDGILYLKDGVYSGSDNRNIIINNTIGIGIVGSSQNGTIIDARGLGRVFNVTKGSTLILVNLTIKNGNVSNSNTGGAINALGTLLITDVTFINNTAGRGGAVWTDNPEDELLTNTFLNCVFINNHATSSSTNGGGALMITSNGTVNIFNCAFINNTAEKFGGAINKNTYAIIELSNCYFENNYAKDSGGAIYNTASNLTIINSTFINNNANVEGGAVYSNTATGTSIYLSYFYNNSADRGGAIYNRHAIKVTGSDFVDNVAKEFGGAIYYNPYSGSGIIQYNRFLNNSNFDLYYNSTTLTINLDFSYNWWGNNTPSIYGTNLANWFVMQLSANNTNTTVNKTINQTGNNVNLSYILVLYNNATNTTTIVDYNGTVNFTGFLWNGSKFEFTNPILATLPDFDVVLTWTGASGTISKTVNGKGSYSEIIPFTLASGFSIHAVGDNENIILKQEIVYVNISVTKTVNQTVSIDIGDNIIYTINVTNHGSDVVNNIIITDVLDSKLVFISATNGGAFNSTTRIITWNISTLGIGGSIGLNTTVRVNGSGLITNLANATMDEFNLGNNLTDLVSLYVHPYANLTITKTVNTINANYGDTISYTITVYNHGPDSANNTQITDVLDSRLALIGTYTNVNYDKATNTMTWTIGNLSENDGRTLTYQVLVNGAGFIDNIANLATSSENVGNKTANITIHAIHKTNTFLNGQVSEDKKTISISSVLLDESGNPIANKMIDFYLDGKYIGQRLTDVNGIAKIDYTQKTPFKADNYSLAASFKGDTENNYSNGSYLLIPENSETPEEDPIPGNDTDPDSNNTDPDTPNPEDENNTNNNPVAKAATMNNTGIPIIIVLIVLLSSLGLIIRKN